MVSRGSAIYSWQVSSSNYWCHGHGESGIKKRWWGEKE